MSLMGRRRGTLHRRALSVPTANLFARYVAGQGITQGGGRVTQWADQFNSNHATESTNGPFATTDYRGRPVVRFLGVNNTLLTLAASHSFSARNVSVFMAARLYGTGPQTLFGLLNYGGGAGHLRINGSPATINAVSRDTTMRPRMNPSMWGTISASADSSGYSNYESPAPMLPVTTDADCAGATIGCYNAGSFATFEAYEILIYEGTVTPQQVTEIRNYLNSTHGLRSVPYTKNVVYEGDSITAGTGVAQVQTYPIQVMSPQVDDWRMANQSSSGATVATLSGRAAATDAFIGSGYQRNVLIVLIGRNDVTAGDNSATVYGNLVSYVQGRVSAGWEVWVGTCIATSSTLQGTINALNQRIRGTVGSGIIADAGASRVLDYGALPEFDEASDSSNPTYYQGDSTHPTAAGMALLANVARNQLVS